MSRLIAFLPTLLFALPQFTQNPSMTPLGGGQWSIQFAVSESTDVEISIVDVRDSSVVRHLAAGKLGSRPPAPLQGGSLLQVLAWDGNDDYGVAAANPESLSVRVRAGLSLAFHQAAGFNPYAWTSFKSVAADRASGKFFVYGVSGQLRQVALREYDTAGNYVRTTFPYSGQFSADQVRGYGINTFSGTSNYAPKSSRMVCPEMDYTIMGNIITVAGNPATANYNTVIGNDVVNNELPVIDPAALSFITIQGSGAIGASGATTLVFRNPSFSVDFAGNIQVRTSPDGNYFFVAGVNSGAYAGRVVRSDKATGTGQILYNVGIGLTGMAMDDSGRVFACDNVRHRVVTFDTLGALIDSLSVSTPLRAEINLKTGELYILNAAGRISKFSSFRSGATLTASIQLPAVATGLAFSEAGGKPVLCAVGPNAWFVRDDGTTLTLIKDFNTEASGANNGFDRIAVDRKTEVCYINDSWAGMFQIWDWHAPKVLPCSTSSGSRMWAGEFSISPSDELYMRHDASGGAHGSGYSGPLDVYSLDRRHAYKRRVINDIYGRYGPGGYGDRGFAVAPNGNVASMYIKANTWVEYLVDMFTPTGTRINTLIYPIPIACGGVKLDLAGNVYVGAYIIDMKHETPGAGFAGDHAYWHATGSVVKFPPTGGSISKTESYNYQRTATNAIKIYPQDLAPYSGDISTENCQCRSARFDLDLYGRLYTPSTFTCRVNVADNEGNTLVRAGKYGNVDDPLENIPLAWPTSAAASEDYLYVSDMLNNRVMRLKMNYVLDNIPGLTEHGTQVTSLSLPASGLFLSAMPNPFNAGVTIAFAVPPRTTGIYRICNVRGQEVFRTAVTSRQGRFVWNGLDRSGNRLPTGCYAGILVLDNGQKVTQKLMMMR